MGHIRGADPAQALLLPPTVDDGVGVGAENPVRFLGAFVDGLDLAAAGFEPAGTGRSGHHPADLLKPYLYGCLNRVRSSRRLEAETHRNLEVMRSLRGLRLDHKLRRPADERLEDCLQRLDRVDAEEPDGPARASDLALKIARLKERKGRCVELQAELERSGEGQVSLTDPDRRAMAAHPKVGVGDHAQGAVDAKHKLIAAQEVTNAGSDLGLLAPTAGAAKEALGLDTIQAVADRGDCQGGDIQACEPSGIEAHVARPQRGSAAHAGLFRKEEFAYDAATDSYLCPGKQRLKPMDESKTQGMERQPYANRAACRGCASRPQCTQAVTGRSAAGWTRPCGTAGRRGWRASATSSTAVERRSNTRSAASSTG